MENSNSSTLKGSSLKESGRALAGLALLLILATDFLLIWNHHDRWLSRASVVVFGLLFVHLARASTYQSHFLFSRFKPEKGLKYWAIVSVGAAIASLIAVQILNRFQEPSQKSSEFWKHTLLYYPFIEEFLYRGIAMELGMIFFSPFKRWSREIVIFVSGSAFALLHVAYGNVAPENLVGGYILAWVFYQSRVLWLPLSWHVFGNFLRAL